MLFRSRGELFSGGGASLVDPTCVTRALDLCTGSACLAILMAQAFTNAAIDAIDLSAEALEVDAELAVNESAKAVIGKRVASWKKTADRYESEPDTKEGRKELAVRAKDAEKKRDRALAAYHQYEVASGALQIAIVLASANVITGAAFLMWGAGALGVLGIVFAAIGFFAPTAIHLF